MKNKILILSFLFCTTVYAQSPDCINAEPFCTGTTATFAASINTTAPVGPFYDCLFTQPNPAFYYLQIDQPGSITITMQSNPLVDIDFICWGPFTDPTTMCDSLTAAYVEDCSYSGAAIEDVDIANALAGEYYILLITNFSNTNTNIDFSQTSGLGTTDCCILGDAGEDNTNPGVFSCTSDPTFVLENELNGTPNSGGTWYDPNGNVINNIFDPTTGLSGIHSYISQGAPAAGSTVACPDDTSLLLITIHPDPIINFPSIDDMCVDDSPLNLNIATPGGGTYSGNGVSSNIFSPASASIGSNTISYNLTDLNGCSGFGSQTITVNEKPSFDLGPDMQIPCRTTFNISPTINGGSLPYNYLWSDGSINSELTTSGGSINLTLTDSNGCVAIDDIIITQDITPIATISGGGEICDDGTTSDMNFTFNGILPWNLTYTYSSTEINGLPTSVSSTINNINSNSYLISTSIPGLYNIVIADDPNECEADIIGENLSIVLLPVPTPKIEPEFYEIFTGEDVTLTSGTYSSYSWFNIDDSILSDNEFLVVDSTLEVYVIVESTDGCFGTSSNAIVNFIPKVELFIPNTFTPNGDEHNDMLVTVGKNIQIFNMIISNRWGEIVFASDEINKLWDGKLNGDAIEQGSYSYKVDIIGTNNRPFSRSGIINVVY